MRSGESLFSASDGECIVVGRLGACACGAVLTRFVLHISAGRRYAARTAVFVLTSVGVAGGGGGGGSLVLSASKIGSISSPLAMALLEVVHGVLVVVSDASACGL